MVVGDGVHVQAPVGRQNGRPLALELERGDFVVGVVEVEARAVVESGFVAAAVRIVARVPFEESIAVAVAVAEGSVSKRRVTGPSRNVAQTFRAPQVSPSMPLKQKSWP